MEEINKELDDIIKTSLPDVPQHDVPIQDKVKVSPAKTGI